MGARIQIGAEVELEVTQIGKACHHGCAIKEQVGDCVMPREGIFARVLKGGIIQPNDIIEVLDVPGGTFSPAAIKAPGASGRTPAAGMADCCPEDFQVPHWPWSRMSRRPSSPSWWTGATGKGWT